MQIAIELKHAAYDCVYLALAAERECRFVTADESFVRKLSEGRRQRFRGRVIGLAHVARELSRPRSAEPWSQGSTAGLVSGCGTAD